MLKKPIHVSIMAAEQQKIQIIPGMVTDHLQHSHQRSPGQCQPARQSSNVSTMQRTTLATTKHWTCTILGLLLNGNACNITLLLPMRRSIITYQIRMPSKFTAFNMDLDRRTQCSLIPTRRRHGDDFDNLLCFGNCMVRRERISGASRLRLGGFSG